MQISKVSRRPKVDSIWMITIHARQKNLFVSVEDIKEVISYLKDNGVVFTKHTAYENHGRYSQLHFHGLVCTRENFRYASLTGYGDKSVCHKTFQIDWKSIFNLDGALEYIYKQARNEIVQHQIIVTNYYTYNYNTNWNKDNA